MSAALRSVGLLDVLFKYVSGALGRAPCIHARLHRLATNLGEKYGLARPGAPMKKVGYVYHPDYLLHTPSFEHPESPDRLVAIDDHLRTAGLIAKLVPIAPGEPS